MKGGEIRCEKMKNKREERDSFRRGRSGVAFGGKEQI
jgi:hypothetical protein